MAHVLPIALFSVSTMFTPGPNNLMIMASGLNFGVRRSMPHYFGICFGFSLMMLFVALGVGALFTRYHWMQQALMVIGITYMVYLAFKMVAINHKNESGETSRKPLTFLQGVLFQWVNPKAWMIAIVALSVFSKFFKSEYAEAIVIGSVFLSISFFSTGTWMFLGSIMKRILKNARQRRIFNIIMALSLLASILMIIFE